MTKRHQPEYLAEKLQPLPPPAWVRRLAVEVGLREATSCNLVPNWMVRARAWLTGEPVVHGLANPTLEQLRQQAACLAAEGRSSGPEFEHLCDIAQLPEDASH